MLQPTITTNQTFREFAKAWVQDGETQNKPSTLVNKKSVLEKHILPVLGDLPLSSVDNPELKQLVRVLVNKGLKPQTVLNVVTIAKAVKKSATDAKGRRLFPTEWNGKFIGCPKIIKSKQNRPAFSVDQVNSIVKASSGRLQMICVLFAASGLRAGELLGLEVQHFNGSAIEIVQSVWGGKTQEPKTQNALRHVDLHPDVAALLKAYIGDRTSGFIFQTSGGSPLGQANLLEYSLHPLLKILGIDQCGFHAFRRFRNTFLRQQSCPEGLVKFWLGHSEKDMTDHYDRSELDLQYRKDVALLKGTGFDVPKTLTPKLIKADQPTSELGAIGRQREAVLV